MRTSLQQQYDHIQTERLEMSQLQREQTALAKRCDQYKKEVQILQREHEKEHRDVEALQRFSLKKFVKQKIGSWDTVIDKELSEAFEAEQRLKEAELQLQNCEEQYDAVTKRIAHIGNLDERYNTWLEAKALSIMTTDREAYEHAQSIRLQREELHHLIEQIQEAHAAGVHVLHVFDKMFKSLDNASGYSMLDMFGGGIISTALKHSEMQAAENETLPLRCALRDYEIELQDVQKIIEQEMKIVPSFALSFADFFFDGFIFDFLVHQKIQEHTETLQKPYQQVKKMQAELVKQKRLADERLLQLQEQYETIIIHSN